MSMESSYSHTQIDFPHARNRLTRDTPGFTPFLARLYRDPAASFSFREARAQV